MLKCPSCEYMNDPSDVICMGCGYPIGNEMPEDIMVKEEPVGEIYPSPLDEDNQIATGEVYDENGELDP